MIGQVISSLLAAIVQVAPGFLAAFSGHASDEEAIRHARRTAETFAPIAGNLRARSAAARAAALKVTEDDVRRARVIVNAPSTGAAHSASIAKLVALGEAELIDRLEEGRAERADEPTGKITVPGDR